MEHLKYPTGKLVLPNQFRDTELKAWIDDIKQLPVLLRNQVESMNPEHLSQSYRNDGWTGQQVIHHIADSHLNAFIRFKWVLTEDSPTIKAYREDLWAELPDTSHTPIAVSLSLLDALHARWSILLSHMKRTDFDKFYVHPEYDKKFSLGAVCKLYSWHGKHHIGHLKLISG